MRRIQLDLMFGCLVSVGLLVLLWCMFVDVISLPFGLVVWLLIKWIFLDHARLCRVNREIEINSI